MSPGGHTGDGAGAWCLVRAESGVRMGSGAALCRCLHVTISHHNKADSVLRRLLDPRPMENMPLQSHVCCMYMLPLSGSSGHFD